MLWEKALSDWLLQLQLSTWRASVSTSSCGHIDASSDEDLVDGESFPSISLKVF